MWQLYATAQDLSRLVIAGSSNSRYKPAVTDSSPLKILADRALDGRLNQLLCRWSDTKASNRVITQLLAQELGGVDISRPTVAKWTAEALEDRAGQENGEAA